MSDTLRLSSDCLFSKWGFNDGDMPEEIMDAYCFDASGWEKGPHPFDTWDWDATLEALVRTYLLPAIPHEIVIYNMGGPHNPVRAESVDGVEVSYEEVMVNPRAKPPVATVVVDVPLTDVLAHKVERVSDT